MITIGGSLTVVLACWIVMGLYWAVSAIFAKKAVTKRDWRIAILWRVVLIAAVIVFVASDKSGAIAFFDAVLSSAYASPIVGSILTVIGVIGALWSRTVLGRNWSGYATYKEGHELVTSGPYRIVRHPMYLSIILMLIGTIVYYGSLLILVALVGFTIMFVRRIHKEDAYMQQLFGKRFERYAQSTRALIPWVW